jgi:hypothetical protein
MAQPSQAMAEREIQTAARHLAAVIQVVMEEQVEVMVRGIFGEPELVAEVLLAGTEHLSQPVIASL